MQDRLLRAAAFLLLLICSAYVAELTIERLFGRSWFHNLVFPQRTSGEDADFGMCPLEYARGWNDAAKIWRNGGNPDINFDDLVPKASACSKEYASRHDSRPAESRASA
jgi:hypothetical protein